MLPTLTVVETPPSVATSEEKSDERTDTVRDAVG
jgi:hypothetical protein